MQAERDRLVHLQRQYAEVTAEVEVLRGQPLATQQPGLLNRNSPSVSNVSIFLQKFTEVHAAAHEILHNLHQWAAICPYQRRLFVCITSIGVQLMPWLCTRDTVGGASH